MLSNITTIRWFDSKHSAWVTDYLNSDEENPLVVSMRETEINVSPQYSFCMSKKMADDIHNLLERVIRQIHTGHDGPDNIKVINLSLNCNNTYVSGKFSVRVKDEF